MKKLHELSYKVGHKETSSHRVYSVSVYVILTWISVKCTVVLYVCSVAGCAEHIMNLLIP